VVAAVRAAPEPLANGEDGLEALRLIGAVYRAARTGTVARVREDG
jgi:predicted dehydrogenase